MPPKSKISDADIATVTQWIQAGAVMPPDQQ
jgi:cytochrome c551/c552